MRFFALGLIIIIYGCATSPLDERVTDSTKLYKRDMLITYKGETFEGVALLPGGLPAYSIEIEARGDLDAFSLTDCHKELIKERAWNVEREVSRGPFGLWKRKIKDRRNVKLTYSPTEVSRSFCPIDLGGFEAEKGRHSWDYITFRPSRYGIKAELSCNGVETKEVSAAICQGKKGLLQRIEFETNVIVDSADNCGVKTEAPYKGKSFEFAMSPGVCSVLFMDKKGREFRLDLIGYDLLKIRSERDD